jgi:hypothetical protein
MEEVGEKVGRMPSEVASRDKNMRETREETMIEGLKKKYPWCMLTPHMEGTAASSEKMEDTTSLFEGKNMRL